MSERTLRTYGATGDDADVERGRGRTSPPSIRAMDADDAGRKSKKEMLDDLVAEEAALATTTWRERIAGWYGAVMDFLYNQLWAVFTLYVIAAMIGLQEFDSSNGHTYSLVDSIYFIAITVTTVGYGDITPVTVKGKWFVIVVIITGIALATVLIQRITATLIGAKEAAELKAQQEVEESLERDLEVMRKRLGNLMSAEDAARFTEKAMHDREEKAKPNIMFSFVFHPLTIITTVILVGAAIFIALEPGLSYLDGVYWAVVTSTTVGYGDVLPTNDGAKIFASLYAFFVVGIMGWAVSQIASNSISDSAKNQAELRSFTLTPKWLAEQGGDKGYVDKFDFLRAMIVARGLMQASEVDKIAARFKQLDVTGDGTLDVDDLLPADERKGKFGGNRSGSESSLSKKKKGT